jgi:hypothetical protein
MKQLDCTVMDPMDDLFSKTRLAGLILQVVDTDMHDLVEREQYVYTLLNANDPKVTVKDLINAVTCGEKAAAKLDKSDLAVFAKLLAFKLDPTEDRLKSLPLYSTITHVNNLLG